MISRALASLGPTAMAIATPLNPDQPILPPDTDASEGDEQEGLVEYEGMLVSASAAQRRRSCPHSHDVFTPLQSLCCSVEPVMARQRS